MLQLVSESQKPAGFDCIKTTTVFKPHCHATPPHRGTFTRCCMAEKARSSRAETGEGRAGRLRLPALATAVHSLGSGVSMILVRVTSRSYY